MSQRETEGEAGKAQDPEGGEASAQDPQAQGRPQDPEGAEAGEAQDAQSGEGSVNRHQYDRDIERRDRRIAELEAQLAEGQKGRKSADERIAELERKFAEAKKRASDERTNAELAREGCIDAVSARARLAEFDGDVARLKEAAPHLFGARPRSTGGQPAGGADGAEAERLRRLAGLPPRSKQ